MNTQISLLKGLDIQKTLKDGLKLVSTGIVPTPTFVTPTFFLGPNKGHRIIIMIRNMNKIRF